jgi:tetratricopeptide (TPR) repeat protein
MKYRFWPLFLVFLITSSCSTEEQQKSEENTEPRKEKVIDGDKELTRLNGLLEKDPNNAELLARRAEILFKLAAMEEGMPDIAKAFRIDSTNVEIRRIHAGYMIASNRVLAARKDYEYIIRKDPGNAESYLGMARTYAIENAYDKAFEFVDEALKRDKYMRDAYVLKGMMFRAQNKIDLAISSFQTAVEMDANFYSGYVALGNLYEQKNDPLAFEYYKTALEIDSTGIDALYGKALYLQYHDEPAEAQSIYRKILTYDSTFVLSHYNQGWIKLVLEKDYDSATHFFLKTVEIEPQYTDAWYNLGLSYSARKNNTKAIECFKNVLKIDPEYKAARQELNRLVK